MPGTPSSSIRGGFPLGLAGATAATRYVGATATGAPASGTFAVGDFVIAQNGSLYVCTIAGSPGTWVALGGSSTEYDYAQITGTVNIASTSEAAPTVIITGAGVAYDGSTRVRVEVFLPLVYTGANGQEMRVNLWDGSTDIGRIADVYSSSIAGQTVTAVRYLTPSAASHTYSVRAWGSAVAGTPTVTCGAGGAGVAMPAFLRVSKA